MSPGLFFFFLKRDTQSLSWDLFLSVLQNHVEYSPRRNVLRDSRLPSTEGGDENFIFKLLFIINIGYRHSVEYHLSWRNKKNKIKKKGKGLV